jgi:ABC-type Mn2+/Zn2+ transport system permease subunit
MEENNQLAQIDRNDSWKVKTLLVGVVLGAATGLGAAYLLTKRAEQQGETLSISSGQGLKLGVLVAGLLRSILTLGEES